MMLLVSKGISNGAEVSTDENVFSFTKIMLTA